MTYAVHERVHAVWRFTVEEETTHTQIDLYRSRAVADAACYLLNAGVARIIPRAIVGCRVEVAR